jgi:Luciferase-like monooxygenase
MRLGWKLAGSPGRNLPVLPNPKQQTQPRPTCWATDLGAATNHQLHRVGVVLVAGIRLSGSGAGETPPHLDHISIATTLDEISAGRYRLGIGAGSSSDSDYEAFGFPKEHRYSRFAETIESSTGRSRTAGSISRVSTTQQETPSSSSGARHQRARRSTSAPAVPK